MRRAAAPSREEDFLEFPVYISIMFYIRQAILEVLGIQVKILSRIEISRPRICSSGKNTTENIYFKIISAIGFFSVLLGRCGLLQCTSKMSYP